MNSALQSLYFLFFLVCAVGKWVKVLVYQRSPSYFFNFFFSNFLRFWYYKKTHIFLITRVKFYSWNMFRLEDINENMPGYGNHN